jgi:hypothetical protein
LRSLRPYTVAVVVVVVVDDDDDDESYLLQLGFHPVAVVGSLFTKIGKRQYKKRNNTHSNIKTRNKQNRQQKYKTKNKHKNIKKHKSSNWKVTKRSK